MANEKTNTIDLLPCPFCGGAGGRLVKFLRGETKLHATGCANNACVVGPYTKWQPSPELADEKWNMRKI